ncbi:dna polymerase epsilon subunit c [Gossypium arboreum]|uniref:Dna polymerase epsilon subunit c n=1 Tax=Gossypium arboreum TaxID=29729 RepID=A0A0B0NTK3_GOSAR|nr:DNA polymerase II subunit B3-1 [Gossypium arboreum]KHG15987.1 dna polymerase epsilon subunit c [Gossypium arboreum]
MASSSKKPKEENKNKKKHKEKSNRTADKDAKKSMKKPEKKGSASKIPTKSKPKPELKPDKSKNKSSNGIPVKSQVITDPSSSSESEPQENRNNYHKNVKLNSKRKRKEEVDEEEEEAKVCRFPMNRIKRIIKTEDSHMAVSQDVVFLVNKAAELFLEKFCEDGYKCSIKDRKKSLSYKHLSTVVHEQKRYDFLSDYVPQKIKAEDALKVMNLAETGEG